MTLFPSDADRHAANDHKASRKREKIRVAIARLVKTATCKHEWAPVHHSWECIHCGKKVYD